MKIIAVLALAACMPLVHAADKPCPPAEAAKADKAIDQVVGWQQLNKAWRDWKHCDTGTVADTFTDAMLRLMVEWKNVEALAESMKDPEYRDFIAAHLKSPAAKDDLKSVRSRATMSCPKGQDAFCKQLAAATEGPAPMDLSPMAPLQMAPTAPAPAPKK
jgi:hypothetical protein